MVPHYTRSLNQQQRHACLAPLDRPLMVLAGAGSGKTGVMAARVQHMLAVGVPPSTILAVTFTRTAEQAMRQRLRASLGSRSAAAVRVSTFHALALSICRSHGGMLDGYTNDFLVCSSAQQIRQAETALTRLRVRRAMTTALSKTCDAMPLQVQAPLEARRVVHLFLKAKAQGKSPDDIQDEAVRVAWESYESWLREHNSLDMVDFVRVAVKILESVPAAREALRLSYTHVLVDEYQDTNALQLKLLTLLAPPAAAKLTVVGDDDQSVFAFQGAQGPTAVRSFLAVYPNTLCIKLEQNYRSSGSIVSVTSALAARNTSRCAKRVFTRNANGERVVVVECRTPAEEASHIVDTVKRVTRKGLRLADVAVLYRSQRIGLEMQSVLRRASIPFNTHRPNIWRSKAVEGTLSLLRFLLRPDDDECFVAAEKALRARTAATENPDDGDILEKLIGYRDYCQNAGHIPAKLSLWSTACEIVARADGCTYPSANKNARQCLQAPAPKRRHIERDQDQLMPEAKAIAIPERPLNVGEWTEHSGGAPASARQTCGGEEADKLMRGADTHAASHERGQLRPSSVGCQNLKQCGMGSLQLASLSRAVGTLSRLLCRLGTLQLGALVQRCAEALHSSRRAMHSSQRARKGTTLLNEADDSRTLLEILLQEAERIQAQAREAKVSPTAALAARVGSSSAAPENYDWAESLFMRARSRLQLYIDELELLAMEQEMAITTDHADAITLCTMHSAKGLEWPAVLCVRMNEGECPSASALSSAGRDMSALEDERRVAYVGLSRAKSFLFISYATLDLTGAPAMASRFLRELPSQHVEREMRYLNG